MTEGRKAGALRARLVAARQAARKAGHVLTEHYARLGDLQVEVKGPNDFVSIADKQAEARILALLCDRFRNDGFIGEETGQSGRADAEFQWCIDPLDGTTNFLRGAHNWCISIGLLHRGQPVMGVIYDPLRKELFEGAVGQGARLNSTPIQVSVATDPANATIGLGHVRRIPVETFCKDTAALLTEGFSFRQVGAGALMLAYVAAGRVDLYFERHMWPWDAVAGLALIRAAGGDFLPYVEAAPGQGSLVLAGNPVLVRRSARLLTGR